MPVLVAIEVTAPEPDQAPWVASMLEACNSALEDGACIRSGGGNAGSQGTIEVTWAASSQATITFRPHSGAAPTVRTLAFRESDEPREKWRTVGFTAALLAGGHSPEPPVDDAEAATPFYGVMTARFLAASGMSERMPKLGGQLRMEGRAWQGPWLVGVSMEYAAAEWSMPGVRGDATWSEVGVGAAWMWQPGRDLQLFTRADVVAQRLTVSGDKKAERDEVQLWQPGVRLALDLHWPLHSHWYVVLGVHAAVVTSPVEVRVDGKAREHVPPVSGGSSVGIQYRF